MDSPSSPTLDSLPNELLIAILSYLPTGPLLAPLLAVNRRFYAIVLSILRARLAHAAAEPKHRLILEAYHPTEKLFAPTLYCEYLGTDWPLGGHNDYDDGRQDDSCDLKVGDDDVDGFGVGSLGSTPHPHHVGTAIDGPTVRKPCKTFAGLNSVYSHFRPVERGSRVGIGGFDGESDDDDDDDDDERGNHDGGGGDGGDENSRLGRSRRRRRRRRRNDNNGEFSVIGGGNGYGRPSTEVYLDEDEDFSQLCVVTNLVKMGPRAGLFLSHVNVGEGMLRLRRGWLADAAVSGDVVPTSRDRAEYESDTGILWADLKKDVGLRFHVQEKDLGYEQQRPVLMGVDEQLRVAYRVEFDEVLVRTRLLLAREERLVVEEVTDEGFFHFEPKGASSHPAQLFFWTAMPNDPLSRHWMQLLEMAKS